MTPTADRPPQPAGRETGRRDPRLLRPFRVPGYRRLALAMVLNVFALGVWTVALVWEVIRLGGGPTQLSLVATASAAGLVLPALVAGAVADRVPQKTILLVVAGTETAGMATIAALSGTDRNRLAVLAGVAFALGLAAAFYYPAYSAWLPALVPASDLLAVNGFEGMVRPTMQQALGPAVAGAVVAAASPSSAVAVAACCSAVGWGALSAVPRTAVRRDLSGQGAGHPVRAVGRDVRDGVVYMVRTPWLLATLLFSALTILVAMGPMEVLVPFLIKDGLGGGPNDHARVLVAFGVGGAIGSMVAGSRSMPRRYLTIMLLGWGLGCLPMALMATAADVWVVIVAGFVMGEAFGAPGVIWGTVLQRRVPPEMLGRVSSLDFFVSLSLMPVSMALAGPVSHVLGLRATFVVAGVVPGVLALVTLIAARVRRDELAHPLTG